ncbi:hypothetical protein KKF25_01675, partial [Patescibacteria group bacterium]|nr:hypothetical protein [Patescibacteria group bacterium]
SSGEAGARSPRMSLLAISVQFYADAKIIAKVPKNAFWPQPKVDSAIIRITPRSICPPSKGGVGEVKKGFIRTQNLNPPTPLCIRGDKKETHQFFKVLHAGFSHPRKQLLNNLSLGLKVPRDKIADILQSAGLKPTQRAETLSVDDWIKLTAAIFIIPLVKGD